MQIKIYEPLEVGPQQSDAVPGLPGERRSMASFPDTGRAWAGMEQVGQTLNQIGARMQQAAEVQELSAAMVATTRGMADIYEQIRSDQSLAGASIAELEQSYADLSGDLRQQIAEGMKENRAKKSFLQKYEEDNLRGRLKVRDMGRQRFISRSRAATDQELQVLADNMVRTGELESITRGRAIIDGKVAAGIFTAEEGGQLVARFTRDAVIGYYERLIDTPKTAPAAYQELISNPAALAHVDERTKSNLIQKARVAAEQATEQAYELAVMADVRDRFAGDLTAGMEYLEDPEHFPALTLSGRSRLIGFMGAVVNRDRMQKEAAIKQRADSDRIKIFGATVVNDLVKAAQIAAESPALSATEKIDILERLQKAPWQTAPDVYADTVQKIHAGAISEPEQVDALRGRGLSNADADNLKAKLSGPRYKEALDYAERSFKLLYPAKDDLDAHIRYVAFVQQVDGDISAQNAARMTSGKPTLSAIEAREVVDGYLQEVTEKRNWWFDKTFRPVDKWMRGEQPFGHLQNDAGDRARPGISPADRRALSAIPREQQDLIADYLSQKGAAITAENIKKAYEQARTYKVPQTQ